jgi:hypothetical protein
VSASEFALLARTVTEENFARAEQQKLRLLAR